MNGLFQHPLWALSIIPASLGLGWLLHHYRQRRRRLLESFARPETLDRIHDSSAAAYARARGLLQSAALLLLLAALAGPQWGVELVQTRSSGTVAVIAVDTSLSMAAEDVPPNRMDKARSALSLLIDGLKDARVGIIAFAGEAHVQCPVTSDLEAAKSLLRRVQVGMVPQPGTDIGKPVRLAARMLKRYSGKKALILLTDGEDFSGDSAAAAEAAKEGLRLFLIGAGTPEGAPIPMRDPSGSLAGYKKDSQGNTVISRLDEAGMIRLAQAGQGAYYRATTSEDEVAHILREIEGLGKSSSDKTGSSSRLRNRYRLPLAASILLMLLSLLPPAWMRASRLLGAWTLLAFLSGCSPRTDADVWKGNRDYRRGRYADALERYGRASARSDKNPRPRFNAGDALYKMEDLDAAAQAFRALAEDKRMPKKTAASAYFNLGNTLYRQQKLPEAAQAYRDCLLSDPSDEDCRHNLTLALRPPRKQCPNKQQDKNQDQKDGGGQPPPSGTQQKSSSQKQKRSGMSREDAERVLQAVKDRERSGQPDMRMNSKNSKKDPSRPEKDW
ncbi:MAG: VWA domain-containing protein [Elusimicrobiota bacterium]|jgi:Ca-activated chloride channel family protein